MALTKQISYGGSVRRTGAEHSGVVETRKPIRRGLAVFSMLVLLVVSGCGGDSSGRDLPFRVEQLTPDQLIQLSGVSSEPGGAVLSRSGEDVLVGIIYGECNGVRAHVDAVHLDRGTVVVTISPAPEAGACAGIRKEAGVRLTIPETTTLSGVEVSYK